MYYMEYVNKLEYLGEMDKFWQRNKPMTNLRNRKYE